MVYYLQLRTHFCLNFTLLLLLIKMQFFIQINGSCEITSVPQSVTIEKKEQLRV